MSQDFFDKQLKLKFFYYTLNYPNGESFKRCQVTLWGPTGLERLGGLSLMNGGEVVKALGTYGSDYAFVIESTKAGDEFLPEQDVYIAWKGEKLFDLCELNYGCAESYGAVDE